MSSSLLARLLVGATALGLIASAGAARADGWAPAAQVAPQRTPLRTWKTHTDVVRRLTPSPDGARVASAGFDGSVQVFSPEADVPLVTFRPGGGRTYWASFSGDGQRLAVGHEDGSVSVHVAATGETTWRSKLHAGPAWSGVWTPKGILTAGADGRVLLTGVGSELSVVQSSGAEGHDGLSASGDGTVVASGGTPGGAGVWVREGRGWTVLPGVSAYVHESALDPEGGVVAYVQEGDPRVHRYAIAEGRSLEPLTLPTGEPRSVAWSRDGRGIAVGTTSGEVHTFNAAAGVWSGTFTVGGTHVWALAYLDRSERLAAGTAEGTVALWSLAAPTPLPSAVDLRPSLTSAGMAPRRQENRNTCSVVVTTLALEAALAHGGERASPLSAEFLNWGANRIVGNTTEDRGHFFHDLVAGYNEYGICHEADMPYTPAFEPGREPSEDARVAANRTRERGLDVVWIRRWGPSLGVTDDDLLRVQESLARGHAVGAGSHHSLLLVGYERGASHDGGGLFRVWDSGTGAEGERSFAFVKANMVDLFWVRARPRR